MKKGFKSYALAWAILLVVFNVICFVTPKTVTVNGATYTKFDSTFWAAYIFITLAFIGQLFCAFKAFQAENATKLFYNLPLITISYTGLIVTMVVGALCMAIPGLPDWVAIIVCVLVLGFTAIAIIKASAAADIVEDVDRKVKAQTFFIKSLTADAESLVSKASTPEAKAACKKVYEAVRYSDPMSNDALASAESAITLKFAELSSAVAGNTADIAKLADELVILVEDRNKKCKVLK